MNPADFFPEINPEKDPQRSTIYHGARDQRGFSEHFSIRLPPYVVDAMSQVVEKVAAYKSKTELVRDAIAWRLHDISQWEDTHENFQLDPLEELNTTLQRLNNRDNATREVIDGLRTHLQSAGKNQDFETVLELINKGNKLRDSIPIHYQGDISKVLKDAKELIPPGWRNPEYPTAHDLGLDPELDTL